MHVDFAVSVRHVTEAGCSDLAREVKQEVELCKASLAEHPGAVLPQTCRPNLLGGFRDIRDGLCDMSEVGSTCGSTGFVQGVVDM